MNGCSWKSNDSSLGLFGKIKRKVLCELIIFTLNPVSKQNNAPKSKFIRRKEGTSETPKLCKELAFIRGQVVWSLISLLCILLHVDGYGFVDLLICIKVLYNDD